MFKKMNERPQLQKAIGKLGFFSLAFGSMIGVGWLTGVKGWLGDAGPVGAILAFLLGGTLMLAIGFCYAKVMQMLPVSGGEVAYAYKAFGTGESFLIGWFLTFGYLSVSAFEAVSIGIVVSYLVPFDHWPLYKIDGTTVYLSHLLLAVGLTTLIAFLNFRGVGMATIFQSILTSLLVLCTAAFVIAGITNGSLSNLEPMFGGAEGKNGFTGVLAVFVTVPFWFVGFDTIPQAAEERTDKVSANKLGQVLLWSIVGATFFYAAVILSVAMVTPLGSLEGAALPTAAAFEKAFESPLLAQLVLFVALIGLLTSWNGFFLSGTRVLFAMGRGHIIHPALGRPHARFGTPASAILFAALVTIAGTFLGKPAVLVLVNVGSVCIALAFFGVTLSLSAILLRSGKSISLFTWMLISIAMLGSLLILLVMLIPGSPAAFPFDAWEWPILAVLAALGGVVWVLSRRQRGSITEEERTRLILDEQNPEKAML
ncbi:MAG TPA: hypothetical protein DEF45_00195 [Rhodopirellula sp.]|nr:hypothetical protein [Rhodopirellula sp.]